MSNELFTHLNRAIHASFFMSAAALLAAAGATLMDRRCRATAALEELAAADAALGLPPASS
eukprot:4810805-Amphidinium_carterae.1